MNGVEPDRIRLVLVGDSITQWWQNEAEYDDLFGRPGSDTYALNLGIAGDRTEDVLFRLLDRSRGGYGQLDDPAVQPDIISLMIGTNHLWDPRSTAVASIGQGQLAVISRLHALRPNAHILVNSVLPTGDANINSAVVQPVNRALCDTVKSLSAGYSWLDLYPAFVNGDNRARPDLFPDGVHLNNAGYRVWQSLLVPALAAIRGNIT